MKTHSFTTRRWLRLESPVVAICCGLLVFYRVVAIAQETDGPGVSESGQNTRCSECSTAGSEYVTRSSLEQALQRAMQETLQKGRGETSWSGRIGDRIFAIAVRRLPEGQVRQRAVPGMLRLVHAVAVAELLKTKAVLSAYEAEGLTDNDALQTAAVRSVESLDVTGSVRGVIHQAGVQDDYVVGYVVADIENVTSHVRRPAPLEVMKETYRDAIQSRMQISMMRKQWLEALESWKHLHQLGLTSEALYINATLCLVELDRVDEAVKVADQFLAKTALTAKSASLEQLGDIFLKIDSETAQNLATTAYLAASERLRSFRTATEIEP
jgi:hypothetical protein